MANSDYVPPYSTTGMLGTIVEEAGLDADDNESITGEDCLFLFEADHAPVTDSTSPLQVSRELPESVPLPISPEQKDADEYFRSTVCAADKYQHKEHHVRFDFSVQEQAAMLSRLEDVAYQRDMSQGDLSDGDIITLQMFAINGLQQERRRSEHLRAILEEDNRILQRINQEHMERRISILNNVIMKRGQELKQHGEFLVRVATEHSIDRNGRSPINVADVDGGVSSEF